MNGFAGRKAAELARVGPDPSRRIISRRRAGLRWRVSSRSTRREGENLGSCGRRVHDGWSDGGSHPATRSFLRSSTRTDRSRSLRSTPQRAIRGTIPRWHSQPSSSSGSPPGPDRRDTHHQRAKRMTVGGVRRGHAHRERKSTTVRQHMDPRAGFTPVDRVRTCQRAPLFTRTLAVSTIADDRSTAPGGAVGVEHHPMQPGPGSRLRPCPEPAVRGRRRHPNSSRGCRHAQLEVNTYTIAVNTDRSSTAAVPPPCGRGRNPGSTGSTIFHSSSGTSSLAKPSRSQDRTINPRHTRHAPSERGLRAARSGREPDGSRGDLTGTAPGTMPAGRDATGRMSPDPALTFVEWLI